MHGRSDSRVVLNTRERHGRRVETDGKTYEGRSAVGVADDEAVPAIDDEDFGLDYEDADLENFEFN